MLKEKGNSIRLNMCFDPGLHCKTFSQRFILKLLLTLECNFVNTSNVDQDQIMQLNI